MSENAGSQSAAPDKDPTGPSAELPTTPELRVSEGNGVVQQLLTFVTVMSAGNRTQKTIAVSIVVFAFAIVVVVTTHGALPWLGGATGIAGAAVGTTKTVKRLRQSKSGE